MYEQLFRPANDPRCSADSVMWHCGSRTEFINHVHSEVRQASQAGPTAIKEIGPYLITWASDPRMLHNAWGHLAANGGHAPGKNGKRYTDFDKSETWALLKAMSKAIRNGTYRRGGIRRVSFPKDRSNPLRGDRTLSLLNIEDRVVQRAIVDVTWPLLERPLGDNVFGFRKGLNRFHALARVEHLASAEDRFIWVVDDIRDAFDNVPRGRLMDLVVKHIPCCELVEFIDRLIDTNRKHGIQQGGPLSPHLLNLFLSHFLDTPWQGRFPDIPLIRYADDLLLLCRSQQEAEEARGALKDFLRPCGMTLKGKNTKEVISDISAHESVDWLGFKIKMGDDMLAVDIAEKAWNRLAEHLELAHTKPNSPLRANDIIKGWFDQMGPCYEFVDHRDVYEQAAMLANECGFDEIPRQSKIMRIWRKAHKNWKKMKIRDTEQSANRRGLPELHAAVPSAFRVGEIPF